MKSGLEKLKQGAKKFMDDHMVERRIEEEEIYPVYMFVDRGGSKKKVPVWLIEEYAKAKARWDWIQEQMEFYYETNSKTSMYGWKDEKPDEYCEVCGIPKCDKECEREETVQLFEDK